LLVGIHDLDRARDEAIKQIGGNLNV